MKLRNPFNSHMETYMKTLRLIPIIIAIVLVLSLSGPAPVEAKGAISAADWSIDLAKTKVGSLVVDIAPAAHCTLP